MEAESASRATVGDELVEGVDAGLPDEEYQFLFYRHDNPQMRYSAGQDGREHKAYQNLQVHPSRNYNILSVQSMNTLCK